MGRVVVRLRFMSGCLCGSSHVIGTHYRWRKDNRELKSSVKDTQYSIEVQGLLREVSPDSLLRVSRQHCHLRDSIDAVLEEGKRLAPCEVGVCGCVERLASCEVRVCGCVEGVHGFRGLVCVWKGWIRALHLAPFCRYGRCLLLRELSSDTKDDCFW